MHVLIRSPYIKILSCYLVLVTAGLIPVTDVARASVIVQNQTDLSGLNGETLESLQTALENELIAERLCELGMTPQEIVQRICQLDSEERELLLKNLDSLQAGGDYASTAFVAAIYLYFIYLLLSAAALVYGAGKGLSKAIKNYSEGDRGVTFIKRSDSTFPAFEGKVDVLFDQEPGEGFILLGDVNAHRALAIRDKEKRKKILIKVMKAEAARNGADTLVFQGEPSSGGYLIWSARAYKMVRQIKSIEE